MKNNLTKKQKTILEKAGIVKPHSANLDLFVGRKISFLFDECKRCLLITDIFHHPITGILTISFFSSVTTPDIDEITGISITSLDDEFMFVTNNSIRKPVKIDCATMDIKIL